jgi:hypothetical protein
VSFDELADDHVNDGRTTGGAEPSHVAAR